MQAGFAVCGWDPAPRRREAAQGAGIELAGSTAEVGSRAERLVVCVVRDAEETGEALLGPAGALAGGGRIGVVMSSIGADAMVELTRAAAEGTVLLDVRA